MIIRLPPFPLSCTGMSACTRDTRRNECALFVPVLNRHCQILISFFLVISCLGIESRREGRQLVVRRKSRLPDLTSTCQCELPGDQDVIHPAPPYSYWATASFDRRWSLDIYLISFKPYKTTYQKAARKDLSLITFPHQRKAPAPGSFHFPHATCPKSPPYHRF